MRKSNKNFELINHGEVGVIVKENKGISNYYPYKPIFEFLEVNANLDHETLKIESYREKEEWTYRLMMHENDPLANWQCKEHAINLIGLDAMTAAENQVKKNIQLIKKQIKEGRLNPVWLNLKSIVDSNVNHYKTDFYYHDCLILNNVNPDKFIFMVRNTGTWLIYQKHDFNKAILDEEEKKIKYGKSEHKIYYWNGKALKEIDLQDALKLYEKMPIMEK
jgi:hypothetical protein